MQMHPEKKHLSKPYVQSVIIGNIHYLLASRYTVVYVAKSKWQKMSLTIYMQKQYDHTGSSM